MAIKNAALTVNFLAYDTSNNVGKTGDSANFTLRLIKDGGAAAAPTNAGSITEPDSTNMPGIYEIALTATEMNADFITLHGVSSTSNIIIIPVFIHTEAGKLPANQPTVDASGHTEAIAPDGTNFNDLSQAEANAAADTALTDYDPPTKAELDSAFTEIKGATWSSSTDTLEAIRDRGDSAWVTATGFSTHDDPDPNGYIANLNGHTAQSGDTFAQLPTNFSDLSIAATSGEVTILETTGAGNTILTTNNVNVAGGIVEANVEQFNGSSRASFEIDSYYSALLTGSVDAATFTPTTTQFETDGDPSDTADGTYVGMIVYFEQNTTNQGKGYLVVASEGTTANANNKVKLTVQEMPSAPSDNDNFQLFPVLGTAVDASQSLPSVSIGALDGSTVQQTGGHIHALNDRGLAISSPLTNGTAQSGTGTTITLASGESSQNQQYRDQRIEIINGTGAGQSRIITDYNGSTKVATVDEAWITNPDATSEYEIVGGKVELARTTHEGATIPTVTDVTNAVTVGTIQTAAEQSMADVILTRDISNVEDSLGDHMLGTLVMAGLESEISGTTWSIYKTDGATSIVDKTLTTDANANPVTKVD